MSKKDLRGMKFGKLTVIREATEEEKIENNLSKKRGTAWYCICDCDENKSIFTYTGNLTSGNTTSCGCSRVEDLSGRKFGRLTATRRAPNHYSVSGLPVTMWYCNCDCGNTDVIVRADGLKKGSTTSCGCYQKETARKRRQASNHNVYDIDSFDYGVGYTNKKEEFYFDKEDVDLLKGYCWRLRKDGYLDAKIPDGSGKRIMMHDLVMCDKYLDHINGKRNDNRKSNLRKPNDDSTFETYNNMNRGLQGNNTSGVTGVHWHSRDNIWEAYISIDNKRIYLGRSYDLDEAIKFRKNAEKKYFGEWSYDESQKLAKQNSINS